MTKDFTSSLNKTMQLARFYVAFTASNIVWRRLDKNAKSVLDVGCGNGVPLEFMNRNNGFEAVGLDIFKPYLKKNKQRMINNDFILCDIREMPLKEKSFDVAICLEVLEHLERRSGEALVESLERVARRQIILTTPVGKYKQSEYDENASQEHKWIWDPSDLEHLGYKVRKIGIRNIGGDEGLASRLPRILHPLLHIWYIIGGLLTPIFPLLAGEIVCIKNLEYGK